MSNRSATHSTFVIERDYDAAPARVFAAWADVNAKGQWFGPGDEQEHELEFREAASTSRPRSTARSTAMTRSTKTSSATNGSCTRTTCTAMERGCRFR